ncbi:MAG: polysaccharide biosynthesis protein [Deltaproteobacteria bacterium]|nr:MAG: polysaccharide biosynthesis protein [Deltaproteobacteria bacterium]
MAERSRTAGKARKQPSRFLRLLYVRWLRRSTIALLHALLWTSAFVLALELRMGGFTRELERASLKTLALVVVLRLGMFAAAGLFDGLWRYSGILELERIVLATTASTLLAMIPALRFGVPPSVLLEEWLASIVAIGGARMVFRELYERHRAERRRTPTLVIGANDTGESLIRDLHRMRGAPWEVVGFLDERPTMQGNHVHGVPVLGPPNEEALRRAIATHRIGQVIFAAPVASGEQTRQLVQQCRTAGVPVKVLPSLAERIATHGPDAVRDVQIEDLLGRAPVELNLSQVAASFQNLVVLITGAAGSIGSELARQTLRFGPRKLLLFDHNENALFFIEHELREQCLAGVLEPLLGDITDEQRVGWVFEHFRPDIVLHAAAHKHVFMMEANPREAARNNVFGTKLLAETADAVGTGAFVLVSTDKAVKPTSVMGASKRVCEMVIQHIARRSKTRFAAVRFGNVLGSNGSVVPLFRAQIASGGPVTVTHPSATRYFMTIPEAAQLVLQAAALGGTGKIFLLDMGRPVKILELARDLIVLSGLRPEVDIGVSFSGLQPGEKLYEELLSDDEIAGERPHPKIMVACIEPPSEEDFEQGMDLLADAIGRSDERELRRALSFLVPEARIAMQGDPLPPPRSSGARATRPARRDAWPGTETRVSRFEHPADLFGSGGDE